MTETSSRFLRPRDIAAILDERNPAIIRWLILDTYCDEENAKRVAATASAAKEPKK